MSHTNFRIHASKKFVLHLDLDFVKAKKNEKSDEISKTYSFFMSMLEKEEECSDTMLEKTRLMCNHNAL